MIKVVFVSKLTYNLFITFDIVSVAWNISMSSLSFGCRCILRDKSDARVMRWDEMFESLFYLVITFKLGIKEVE